MLLRLLCGVCSWITENYTSSLLLDTDPPGGVDGRGIFRTQWDLGESVGSEDIVDVLVLHSNMAEDGLFVREGSVALDAVVSIHEVLEVQTL